MENADILKAVTKVADHARHVISEEMVICKFLLVKVAPDACSLINSLAKFLEGVLSFKALVL